MKNRAKQFLVKIKQGKSILLTLLLTLFIFNIILVKDVHALKWPQYKWPKRIEAIKVLLERDLLFSEYVKVSEYFKNEMISNRDEVDQLLGRPGFITAGEVINELETTLTQKKHNSQDLVAQDKLDILDTLSNLYEVYEEYHMQAYITLTYDGISSDLYSSQAILYGRYNSRSLADLEYFKFKLTDDDNFIEMAKRFLQYSTVLRSLKLGREEVFSAKKEHADFYRNFLLTKLLPQERECRDVTKVIKNLTEQGDDVYLPSGLYCLNKNSEFTINGKFNMSPFALIKSNKNVNLSIIANSIGDLNIDLTGNREASYDVPVVRVVKIGVESRDEINCYNGPRTTGGVSGQGKPPRWNGEPTCGLRHIEVDVNLNVIDGANGKRGSDGGNFTLKITGNNKMKGKVLFISEGSNGHDGRPSADKTYGRGGLGGSGGNGGDLKISGIDLEKNTSDFNFATENFYERELFYTFIAPKGNVGKNASGVSFSPGRKAVAGKDGVDKSDKGVR